MPKKIIKKEAKLPDLPKQNDWYKDVWDVVSQIPKGRVTNYGTIAKYLGNNIGARMVGWAMGNAENAPTRLPAHRVVNSVGKLSAKNQFGQNNEMQKLLEKDGLEIKNDAIVNFKKHFWDPAKELEL